MSTRERKKPDNWIRLACTRCDRDDFDGITENHLELIRPTWGDITEEQSWEESNTVWEEWQCRKYGRSNLDWWTHLGACPDCLGEIEVVTDEATVNRLLF